MLDTLELLFKNLKDPLLVLIFLLLIGAFVVTTLMLKFLVRLLYKRDEYISTLHSCIAEGLGENNKTLGKVVTLIEGMVYGRIGK